MIDSFIIEDLKKKKISDDKRPKLDIPVYTPIIEPKRDDRQETVIHIQLI
jgi:hypothetical protein